MSFTQNVINIQRIMIEERDVTISDDDSHGSFHDLILSLDCCDSEAKDAAGTLSRPDSLDGNEMDGRGPAP